MSYNKQHYSLCSTHSSSPKVFHIPYKRRIYKSGKGIMDFQKALLLISPLS